MEKKYRITNKDTGEFYDVTEMNNRTIEPEEEDGKPAHYVDVKFKLSDNEIGDITFEKSEDGTLSNERYTIRDYPLGA